MRLTSPMFSGKQPVQVQKSLLPTLAIPAYKQFLASLQVGQKVSVEVENRNGLFRSADQNYQYRAATVMGIGASIRVQMANGDYKFFNQETGQENQRDIQGGCVIVPFQENKTSGQFPVHPTGYYVKFPKS